MCPRKRHVPSVWRSVLVARRSLEGPAGGFARAGRRGSASSYPSRGWGPRGGIVSGSAPSPEPCRSRRTLQPAGPRSHDERCPSGAGRGSPPGPRNLGWWLSARAWGLGLVSVEGGATRARCGAGSSGGASASPLDRVRRRRLRGRRRRARRAERASAREACSLARGAGIGRCRGRARGSSWLQKSTSGARSRPQGPGSSRLAPRSRGRAQRVKSRRKPDRGGESHEHASSDTGGGLSEIPRKGARAPQRPGEGALVDGRRPGTVNAVVFDETAAEPGLVPRGDGDAAAMPDPPRDTRRTPEAFVAGPARGR